jgi:hypothetical protein
MAKYIKLPQLSETNALVQTSAEGLCALDSVNQNNIRKTKEYAMANGLAELQKLKPFVVQILNFSSKPGSIQKHAVVGFAHATPSEDQLCIIPASTDTEENGDMDKSVLRYLYEEWMHDVNLNHLEVET